MMSKLADGARIRFATVAVALALAAATTGTASAQLLGRSPVPPADVPGGAAVPVQSPAALAEQSMRIDQMQEQMRQLNGQIEQLTYQVQQLQEMLRRAQEDNEFRFQQLEKGGTPQRRSQAPGGTTAPTGGPAPGGTEAPAGDLAAGQPPVGQDTVLGAPPAVLGTIPGDGTAVAPPSESALGGPLDLSAIARGEDPSLGAPVAGGLPGVSSGVADTPVGAPMDDLPADPTTQGGGEVAALNPPADPQAAYDEAYAQVLSGNYEGAEAGFKRFLQDHPQSQLAGNAHFWLGEAYYARKNFRDAADAFLSTYRDYPKSQKAPESLLKLGLSLEGLGEKDAACATYGELAKRYPDAPAAIRDRVAAQRTSAGC